MRTSEALRRTKASVWNGRYPYGKETYICHAAVKAVGVKHGMLVRAAVKRVMPNHTCLEDWMDSSLFSGDWHKDVRKMQETRQAWLDYLITLYESEGD